jgi:hypothetical protein
MLGSAPVGRPVAIRSAASPLEGPGVALLRMLHPVEAVAASPDPGPSRHLRRCTYRRLSMVRKRPLPLYDVACLYPDRAASIPLGDLESARPICEACTADHIFRPDED